MKSTIQQYGWIVVTVIIISILIGLAVPAANYMRDNGVGVVSGLGDKLQNGLNPGGNGGSSGTEDPDNSGSGETQGPQKNEYGFYYGVPYVSDTGYEIMVLGEGYCEFFYYDDEYTLTYWYNYECEYEYNEANRTATGEWDINEWYRFEFSEDGNSITYTSCEFEGESRNYVVDTTMSAQGVIYGKEYRYGRNTYIFNENNTVTVNGTEEFDIRWYGKYAFKYTDGSAEGQISLDGSKMQIEHFNDGE